MTINGINQAQEGTNALMMAAVSFSKAAKECRAQADVRGEYRLQNCASRVMETVISIEKLMKSAGAKESDAKKTARERLTALLTA